MKDKKVGIVIQARMGSTRLPGKVMMKIRNKTIIEIIVERLKGIKNVDKIILATSKNAENNILEREAERLDIDCFRGSEENVLDRFYGVVQKFNLDIVVRVTGDCPLIDIGIIEEALEFFEEKKADIVSNTNKRTYPHGLDFEIFTRKSLEKAWRAEKERLGSNFDEVFVNPTEYIKKSGNFKHVNILYKKDLSGIRITLDYPEDFEVIKKVYEKLSIYKKDFGLKEIEKLNRTNPEIFEINNKFY
jgi:spore coat polysaccharide biosynthesis protein SpsF (cytidylyltransferase family)